METQMRLHKTIIMAALALTGTAFISTQASAAIGANAAQLHKAIANGVDDAAQIQLVRRRGRGFRGRRFGGRGFRGARFRFRRRGFRHFYGGYWYANPWWMGVSHYRGGHVRWCLNRYRSYNPRTDSFRGLDGRYHICISPYSY